MFLNELFLQEDVAETRDLMAIALYIAQWFKSDTHTQGYDGEALTLRQIEKISGVKAPVIQTKSVKFLMYQELPGESPEPLRFAANNEYLVGQKEFGAYSPPHVHAVAINTVLLTKRKRSIPSTILHELDHALVDMKSGGRAVGSEPYIEPSNKDSYQRYIRHPVEINARFAQSLWDMASRYDRISKNDLLPTITNVLAANQITRDIIPDPKQYRKLITRSYKFLDDVGYIMADKPKDKQTLVQKVKSLVKKWTNSIA